MKEYYQNETNEGIELGLGGGIIVGITSSLRKYSFWFESSSTLSLS
jgi:hypothetical protein